MLKKNIPAEQTLELMIKLFQVYINNSSDMFFGVLSSLNLQLSSITRIEFS